jgi:CheY-like chemotaxis protein/glycine cleavage system H lipoate-binding protein
MNGTRNILVVEDEPLVTQAVTLVCGDEGMRVTAVESGAEALRCLQERPYRLVLCDIMMQGMDGFGFLAELARHGLEVPVVMMTGYSTVENALRSLRAGAVDYLPKPFTADELLTVVRRALRYSALLDAAAAPGLERDASLSYVPCPAHYLRLGCVSWALMEAEGTARIGVSDLFLKAAEGVRSFEFAEVGEDLVQGIPCAVASAPDGSSHGIMCPMSGRVLEINAEVQKRPSLVEKDPYFKGWLYRILPSDPESNLQWLTL